MVIPPNMVIIGFDPSPYQSHIIQIILCHTISQHVLISSCIPRLIRIIPFDQSHLIHMFPGIFTHHFIHIFPGIVPFSGAFSHSFHHLKFINPHVFRHFPIFFPTCFQAFSHILPICSHIFPGILPYFSKDVPLRVKGWPRGR